MLNFIKSFVEVFRVIEKWLLVFFLALIIFVSSLQIILRNFFTAVEWFDTFLKYCVLWAGMIAAGIATYEDRHIKIDLIGRFTKGKMKIAIMIITNFFAGIVCAVLFVTFIKYIVEIEYTSSDPAPFLNIKRWVLILICPISFFLMSIRFFTHTWENLNKTINYEKENEPVKKNSKPKKIKKGVRK